jgi:hypothetical protein
MTVFYEWDVELQTTVDAEEHEIGEVLDHRFQASYQRVKDFINATVPDEGCEFVAVLIRTDDDNRAWAYVQDGKLPEYFLDAYNSEYRKVPKKFHDEVAKVEEKKNDG